MKKEFVKCPICDSRFEDECKFAKLEKVEGDKLYIYCCEHQIKKVKKE